MVQRTVAGRMVHPGVQAKGAEETAVYRLYDIHDQLLYVGMGRHPMGRWAAHADQHAWWRDVARFEVSWYVTRQEAAAEERRVLKSGEALHNIHGTPKWASVVSEHVRGELALRQGQHTDLHPPAAE